MLSVEIGFIRFIAGVGWHPKLLGSERMDNASFEACLGKGSLRNEIVGTRPFHSNDEILDVVFSLSLTDEREGDLEERCFVLESSRRNETLPK